MSEYEHYIPVVDVRPLYSEDTTEWQDADRLIGDAFKYSGGFIASHIPKPVRPDLEQTTKLLAFYNLTPEQRLKVGTRKSNPESSRDYRGYSANIRDGRIRNEIYDIGPAYEVTGPDIPDVEQLIETNAWPEAEPEVGWQAEMERYYDDFHDFSKRIMRSIIRYLGADEISGAARFDKSNSTLRLLNYPGLPEGFGVDHVPENSLREFNGEKMRIMAIEHKDQCCLTLLWQSGVGGLQMQSADGSWKAVPHVEDGISVHLGMAMESMTDHVLAATPHRVLGKDNARQSIGFFLEPNLHASVKPFVTNTVSATESEFRDSYAAALLQTFAERKLKLEAQKNK